MMTAMADLDTIKRQLMLDRGLKKPISERTARLRDAVVHIKPKIFSERALIVTESMKETEGEPMVIRKGKGLEKILSEMTIFIRPYELIVGNQAAEPRSAPIFPEYGMRHIIEELDGIPIRPDERAGDRFLIDKKDEAILREIAGW